MTPEPGSDAIPTAGESNTGETPLQGSREASLSELAIEKGEPILRYFEYSHLPRNLAAVSREFAFLARLVVQLPRSAERTVALRKLLEGKDAAVRAALA